MRRVLAISLAAVLTAVSGRMLTGVRHRARLAHRLGLTAVGWRAWFDQVSGRHRRRFDAAFPEALEAVARGLRSGASAVQSLQEASAAAPDPLADTLRAQIHEEVRLSVSIGMGINKLVAKVATRQAKPGKQICDFVSR